MIIRDKQDLRKCVKQCVRRADIVDTCVQYDACAGGYGVENYFCSFAPDCDLLGQSFQDLSGGSPFAKQPAFLLAALDAMQLPVNDLEKAETIINGIDQGTYLTNTLSAMRARQVVCCVTADQSGSVFFADDRVIPMISVDQSMFNPGRYGVDYACIARELEACALSLRARAVRMARFDEKALEYCLLPLCEDASLVLHIHCQSQADVDCVIWLLSERFTTVRALLSADASCERYLIAAAERVANVLVRLSDLSNLRMALCTLGVRFVPYASCAKTPEEMLGGWIRFKEAFWEAMAEAYLSLARTGFELTREQIEQDMELLLCGNYEKLYG